MWILPKQLISAFVQDTAALTSDSAECAQACAQSLTRRSKPSQSSAYLREWKAGNLTRLRFGAISSHSLGRTLLDWWISCLVATRANHSAQPESASEPTIQDTSGQALQQELPLCDRESVSLKTSKGTLALDSEKSLENWKSWVTRCRGEYSARLNVVRHTSGNECLSWPTASARDWKDSAGMAQTGINPDGSERTRIDQLARAVFAQSGQPALDNHSTHGSRQGSLNPRWVETLMGLPVGWTMPSCSQPVTTAPTSSDSSATE